MNQPLSADIHFERLSNWLQLESEAETLRLAERLKAGSTKNAEKSGDTILDLAIGDHAPGVGGHSLLTLIKRNRQLTLPWNRLRVGSPVVLTATDLSDDNTFPGVVSARNSASIQVAVNEWPDGDRFRLDLSPDEITRKRQHAALRTATSASGRLGQLRDVLLHQRAPVFGDLPLVDFFTDLNPSQQDAVRFGLAAQDFAIIHGPPGTGKTTTVAELIRQAVAAGDKVLACAPSNTAVDNLLDRLVAGQHHVVRIGHPARVDAGLREHTLDALVQNHEIMRLVRDMLREAEQLFRKAGRFTRAKPLPGAKRDLRREARQIREHARLMEQQAVDHVLDQANIVCATTTLDDSLLGDRRFDLVVIDEACQCTEPGCWVPILRADRLVLAGDHCQLPPTVLSAAAAREGLQVSLLERLVQTCGGDVTLRLDEQYRMHESIMRFSSDQFYDRSLVAHPSVAAHVLADRDGIESVPLTTQPVTFFDTAGAGWDEELEPDGASRRNPAEGAFVLKQIDQLLAAGVSARDIAVIAPYAAQVRWLRDNVCSSHSRIDELEIDTVDGFQGREKEAVVISLTRSNASGEIGFLGDIRRMNVALTRARRSLIIVGDSATLGGHAFYGELLEYVESIGAYHTIWEDTA